MESEPRKHDKKFCSSTKTLRAALILMGISVAFASCSNPIHPGSLHPNQPPHTSLANIPTNDQTGKYPESTPTVTLYWVGNDADGFVTAFTYRWSYDSSGVKIYRPWTTLLNYEVSGYTLVAQGDVKNVPSVYNYFATLLPSASDSITSDLEADDTLYVQGDTVFTASSEIINPDEGTFIFESLDTLNPHTFEVAAVDNDAAVDPDPASVTFWTPQAQAPIPEIVQPYPPDSSFVADEVTATFPGLTFYFQAIDPYSKGMLYSWSVDSLHWSPYSTNTSAVVTAADMKPPYTGMHTLYLNAKNDFGLVDSIPASYKFDVIVPSFVGPHPVHRILLLDDTKNGLGLPFSPKIADLDAYYETLLDSAGESGNYDVWDVEKSPSVGKFPNALQIANYSTVVFYDDDEFADLPVQMTSGRSQLLASYLAVGGKLIMSGWNAVSNFASPDSFFDYRVHLETVQTSAGQFYRFNTAYDFTGATGQNGYPNLVLDSTKLSTVWKGALNKIAVVSPRGFAENIYSYNSKSDSVGFQGYPVGVRYLGITYSVVYFGFPLYFMEQHSAIDAMTKALKDIGE